MPTMFTMPTMPIYSYREFGYSSARLNFEEKYGTKLRMVFSCIPQYSMEI